jgi:gliding motility-associated-like protein
MYKKTMIFFLCLTAYCAKAQYDNIWYFGEQAGLDFSSGIPLALLDSQMIQTEGCASIAGPDGQLLFYTNGVTVWNKNHQVMQNGLGLFGDLSSTQVLIAAKPGEAGSYYIFTVDDEGEAHGLNYSEVDMAADGGLGAIIQKNIQMVAPATEKVTATRHANGTDVWIVSHEWGTDAFYSYLVTAAGVSANPVISNSGTVVQGDVFAAVGNMKVSADGSRLALINYGLNIELFDFDTTTGLISNPLVIMDTIPGPGLYGLEFSLSGNVLYVTDGPAVFQYDLLAANIPSSLLSVAINPPVSTGLQLGPDGKIYIAVYGNLGVISNPEVLGTGCNVIYDAVNLGGRFCQSGLPFFLPDLLYLDAITVQNPCAGNEAAFVLNTIPAAPDSVVWDFGDGTSSNEMNPVHTYAAAGIYSVKVAATKSWQTRVFTQSVTISLPPAATAPQDLLQCSDDANSVQAVFNLALQDAEILGGQDAQNYTVTYYANNQDAQAGNGPLLSGFTNTLNPQTIYARVTSNAGGCYAITSFLLPIVQKPVIDMPDTYTVCGDGSITLAAPSGFDSYVWSGGQTTRTIQVTAAGSYTVTVSKVTGSIICEASKTVSVTSSGPPIITEVTTADWTDAHNTIAILAEGTGDYEYSIDGLYYQDNPVFNGLESGLYTVYARDKNGCGEDTKQVLLLMYPRFFTPNGDGTNETWKIEYAYFEPGMLVYIFDRYGKLLTSFKGTGPGWDGKYNGHNLPATDYWFVVQRQDGKEFKGHFAMLR